MSGESNDQDARPCTSTTIPTPTNQNTDDTEKFESVYVNALRHGMTSLENGTLLSDIEIVVEGRHFKCHKVILNIFSGFFKSMFTSGMKECDEKKIELKSISANVFESILTFIYSGAITCHNLEELLSTSLYLQIQSLTEICQKKISGQIKQNRAFELWRFSKTYDRECQILRLACEEWMLANIISYSKSEEFIKLNVEEITFLLSQDSLSISTEDEVCRLAVTWFQNDIQNRVQYLHQVFQHVRFPLVTKSYLDDIKQSFPTINHNSLTSYLEEAKRYHDNPAKQCDINTHQSEPRIHSIMEKGIIVISGCKDKCSLDRSKDVYFYSFQSNAWVQLPKLPHDIEFGFATCTYGQSHVYISGGHENCECYRYSGTGQINEWKRCRCMVEDRAGHALIAVNKSIYAIGGMQNDYSEFLARKTLASIEKYEIKGKKTWNICGELQIEVCDAAVSAIGDVIYVFSEVFIDDPIPIQCFDTSTNTSSVIQRSASFRNKVPSVGCDKDVYLVTSEDGEPDAIQRFRSNKLTKLAQLPEKKLKQYEIVKIGPKLFILGGSNESLSDEVFEYNLETENFRKVEFTLPYPLYEFGCHVITVNKRLIAK